MKKESIFLLLFLFVNGMALSLLPLSGSEKEVANIWSGREAVLPGSGNWRLSAEHGRVLAEGQGEVKLHLPALTAGAMVEADLTLDGKTRKVKIWSPRPLDGLNSPRTDDPRLEKALKALGASETPLEEVTFRLPDKREFPLALGKNWTQYALCTARVPGSLSVYIDKKEQSLDLNGGGSYIMLQDGKKKLYIFSPEFDLDNIDNVLLLKRFMEKQTKAER